MADTGFFSDLNSPPPTLDQYLRQPPAPPASQVPPPSGEGNWLTAGFLSGVHEGLGALGSAGEAAGTLFGAPDLAKAAAAYAAKERVTAATYQRPDLEGDQTSWYNPTRIAYNVAKALPMVAGVGAAGLAAGATAPEDAATLGLGAWLRGGAAGALNAEGRAALTAGVSSYPFAVGSNVQANEDFTGAPITPGQAAKAAVLGVPEAAINAVPVGRLEHAIVGGVEGNFAQKAVKTAVAQAPIQAAVSGAQTALTQMMGDPNRTFAQRAQEVVQSALQGGLVGGVIGGAIGAISKTPPARVETSTLDDVTKQALSAEAPSPQAAPLALPAPPIAVPPEAGQVAPVRPLVDVPTEALVKTLRTISGTDDPTQQARAETILQEMRQRQAEGRMTQGLLGYEPSRFYSGEVVTPPAPPLEGEVIDQTQRQLPPPLGFDLPGRTPYQGEVVAGGAPVEPTPLRLAPPILSEPNSLPGRPPFQGEVIQGRQLFQGEPVDTTPRALPAPVAEEPGVPPRAAAESVIAGGPPADIPTRIPRDVMSDQDLLRAQQLLVRAGDPRAEIVGRELAMRAQEDAVAGTPDEMPSGPAPVPVADTAAAPPAEFKAPWELPKESEKVQAQTLRQWVRANGGLQDEGGDVKSLLDKPQIGILNKKGMTLDQAREKAAEAGYLGADRDAAMQSTTPADFLAALTKDRHYSSLDEGEVDRASQAATNNAYASRVKAHADDIASYLKDSGQPVPSKELLVRAADLLDSGEHWPADTREGRIGNALEAAATQVDRQPVDQGASTSTIPIEDLDADFFPNRSAAVPATPRDVGLAQSVQRGASGRDLLADIRDNSPSPAMRDMAAALHRSGADAKVRFSDPDGMRFDNDVATVDNASAAYSRSANTVHLFDGRNLEANVLHEMTHAATVKALDGNGTAAATIKDLYNTLKARSPDSKAYGLTSPHEFVAEAMSNPAFRDELRRQPASTGGKLGDMWQAFKNAVFKALRLPERARSFFDQVMEQMPGLYGENRNSATMSTSSEGLTPNVRADQAAHDTASFGDRLREASVNLASADLGGKAKGAWSKFRGASMQWMNPDQIAFLARDIPAVREKIGVEKARSNRQTVQFKISNRVGDWLSGLNKTQAKAFNAFAQATHLGVNGLARFEDHAWLDPRYAKEDRSTWERARSAAAELNKTPQGRQALEGAIAGNRAQWRMTHIASLDAAVKNNPEFAEALAAHPAFAKNFLDDIQFNAKAHDNPTMVNDLAGANLQAKLKAVRDVISPLKDAAADLKPGTPSYKNQREAFEKAKGKYAALDDIVGNIARSEGELDRVPNFPAWRRGDYFVSGKFSADKGQRVSDDKVKALQDAMTGIGLGHVVLDSTNDNPSIYVRLDGQAQAEGLAKVFREMQAKGVLDKGTAVANGLHEDALGRHGGVSQAWAYKMLGLLRGNLPEAPEGLSGPERASWENSWRSAQADMANQFMSMLPDSSLTKLSSRRKLVQGYMPDIVEATKDRMGNTARGIANLSVASDMAGAISNMRKQLDDFKHTDAPIDRKNLAHQLVKEVAMREAARQWMRPTPLIDAVRAITHISEIGLSVPYTMMLGSQIGTLVLPELGKRFGYAKAAKAIASVTPQTLEVMRTALAGTGRRTFQLRDDNVSKAKLSQPVKDFILNMDNRGAFNESSFTHQNTQTEFPHWAERGIELGSMMSLYSEQLPRVIAALAARKLAMESPEKVPHGMSVEDYAHQANREANFGFGEGDTARGFGAGGTFGPAGKLMSQFMGFSTKLTEKIYREVDNSFGKLRPGETQAGLAARRAEGRKWLASHAAATAVVAGSLGLPGPSFAMSVFDKLADWATGEDSWDTQAAYRDWLANVFGPKTGEVIARGLPRLADFDMSHAGEGDLPDRILPFMQLLTEKRKMEDAEGDLLRHLSGSAAGLLMRSASGVRDMSRGDFLKGAIKVLPELFRSPLEAAQYAQAGGLVKNNGEVDPRWTPTTGEIAETAFGLDPSGLAEAQETARDTAGLEAMRHEHEQVISQHLVTAYMRGDQPALQHWAAASMDYAREHPGYQPPAFTLNEAIQRRMEQQLIARATGMPLGVSLHDLATRRAVGYGSFGQ